MELTYCLLCGKQISDLLKHLRFSHKIKNDEEFENEIRNIEYIKKSKQEFSIYVENLQHKKKKNEITSEEYRELITEWVRQHKKRQ